MTDYFFQCIRFAAEKFLKIFYLLWSATTLNETIFGFPFFFSSCYCIDSVGEDTALLRLGSRYEGVSKKYVDFYYNFKTTQRKSIKFCTHIKQLNVKRIMGFTLMYYTCV